MFIRNIADYLVNLTCKDIKPDIYSVFDSPCENNCTNNVNSEKLTILEILNAIGCRLKNLFGFVKINTSTETIDEDEAAVNVSGDVDNLNFDFKIPRSKTGPQGPAGPGVATGGTTGQVLAKKSDANFDTEWINNSGGGSTVSVNVGETTTGEPGTNASVTNSGDETNVVLNFTIPRGDTGPAGPAGDPGPAGPGVATGGTTGQVLAKKSDANFDTEWINNSGGGSTVSVNVGETTTGEPGTNASVTNSGDETNVVLNFTIPRGDPGPENLVIITATASTTVQGEYIPDTTYTKALADIQANKAVMIKLENVPGRYYIPYSSSNAEILASAGTVSGSKQSIELYLIKWTAQGNIITLAGTKEGCIADGGTTGQVLVKKSDESFDTEWATKSIVVLYDGNTSITFSEAFNLLKHTQVSLFNTLTNISYVLNISDNGGIRGVSYISVPGNYLATSTLLWNSTSLGFSYPISYLIPSGGKTGQSLVKKSDTSGDMEWKTIENGSTVSVSIGETTTGEPGTNASVTNSGDETNVVLNFTIPRGDTGPAGPAGDPGPAGPGVATGGTTGQILAKKSNANFDTEWINNSGGGLNRTELWTNPNVSEAFSAQTVTLSDYLINYEMIVITFSFSTTNNALSSYPLAPIRGLNRFALNYYSGYRFASYLNNTIQFFNAKNIINDSNDNTIIIPYKIFGYK